MNTVAEWCSNCSYEVELPEEFKAYTCPHCKERLLPCAQCETQDCGNCPLENSEVIEIDSVEYFQKQMIELKAERIELRAENRKLKSKLERFEGDHIIAVQIWQREDVSCALEDRGYEASEENIERVLNEGLEGMLSDCSDGNNSIGWCISGVSDDLVVEE